MAGTRRQEKVDGDVGEDEALDLRPLTARSVVLSLLLGSHPPRLPVRVLVACGALFGIGGGALRVALSRLVAAGDVTTDTGDYTLSDRLQQRQGRQDRDRRRPTGPWDGTWMMLLAPPDGEGHDLRTAHLAPAGDRLWMRPDNRPGGRPSPAPAGCRGPGWVRLDARTVGDPAVLVEQLWDLPSWAKRAEGLMAAFDATDQPSVRFVVAAAILRHLRTDPMLPVELLPPDWPGERLRDAYDRFEAELSTLLDLHRRAGPAGTTPQPAGTAAGTREARARHSSP